ncbi:MAG: molecular chaperone TorD family protein [Deltaproteobacteria bacterium]|nr:molecular chaperone TorD family protein [Deltaproteobacteria bacterium]
MNVMTNGEKEQFCAFAASLLAPPDVAMVDDLRQEELRSLIEAYAREWGGDRQLPSALTKEAGKKDFLSTLQEEYARLFGQWEGEKISLVESAYKPWTTDKECGMVFAASTGLVMGDYALHMLEIYRQLSLKVPEEFRSMPDHLVLELDFLALLYKFASSAQIERFIGDHLDWVPELKEAMEKANPHPFYRNAVELIHLFLQNEAKNEKGNDHGQKKIH